MTKKTRLNRLDPKDRRELLLVVAFDYAKKVGFMNMTRDGFARFAECSEGLITKRFGSMKKLRALMMREAIKREELVVLAQGVAAMDKIALSAPAELQARAAQELAPR